MSKLWFELKDLMIKTVGLGMIMSGVVGIIINFKYDYLVGRGAGAFGWGRNQWAFFGFCLLQILWGFVVHDFTKDFRE